MAKEGSDMRIEWIIATTIALAYAASGCGSTCFVKTGVSYQQDQLSAIEAAAPGAGFTVKSKKDTELRMEGPHGRVDFFKNAEGELNGLCGFDDRAACAGDVKKVLDAAKVQGSTVGVDMCN